MSSALRDELRLLPHVVAYQWRKASAFRVGLVIREALRGVGRPVVAMFVYYAMFASAGVSALGSCSRTWSGRRSSSSA